MMTPVKLDAGGTPLQPPTQIDMNIDGILESISSFENQVVILSDQKQVWSSPTDWDIYQYEFTDLNQDDVYELSLLVWRPYKTWPVDEYLPFGGKLTTHQDKQGNSCHLILIGWINNRYEEIWAGSALADPVTAFTAADLNDDGYQELITLEGQYARKRSSQARIMKVWKWNGFGFSIVSYVEGYFDSLVLMKVENDRVLVLTP